VTEYPEDDQARPAEDPAGVGEQPAGTGRAPVEDPAGAGEEPAGTEPAPVSPPEAPPATPAGTEPAPVSPPEALPAAPAAEAAEPLQAQPAAAPSADEDLEEVELAPREKPEIPGADLIPDIVPEGEQFLDAEAQAAAEAEAEAAAALAAEEAEDTPMPIADATIDLAAGARYTATGKRKTAVARVVLKPGSGSYAINGRALETVFPREPLQRMIRQPLETVGFDARMDVVARMHGGGVAAQAGALRHGISRALIVADPNLRGELKRRGFLTRDPRVKERKKAGLKKARKRPQFSKR